jgi:hypothetical protein
LIYSLRLAALIHTSLCFLISNLVLRTSSFLIVM